MGSRLCFLSIALFVLPSIITADLFSIYNEKDDNTINSNSIKKNNKPTFPRETFDLAFPFFNELFPLSGLESKQKDILNKNKDDKDLLLDISDTAKQSKTEKIKKKNGKDKLIMSFTELFIPFQNHHKNTLEVNNIKKNDIFDEIFNNFPFIDFDGRFFEKHDKQKKHSRLSRRKYEKSIISPSNNNTNNNKLILDEKEEIMPKHSLINRFETQFFKSPNAMTLFSKDNGSEEMCCSHEQCHKGGHCSSNKCKFNLNHNENNNLYNENNINKKSIILDKTVLIYALPALIGVGALIFGIEVLRRHNELVKQTPFLSQYNQVQTC